MSHARSPAEKPNEASVQRKAAEWAPQSEKESVRLSLKVSNQLNDMLERVANETHTTKSDVLRRALVLMEVAHTAKAKGKRIGIAKDNEPLETEFVGF